MIFFDYVFYRVYLQYLKKNDPAKFASTLYISVIYIFLLSPLLEIIAEIFRKKNGKIPIVLFVMYIIFILLFNFIRYFKNDKIEKMKMIFKSNKYNKQIPGWIFFFILPFFMIIGIMLVVLISKYIIEPYRLSGCF
jgi:hypothetical protein